MKSIRDPHLEEIIHQATLHDNISITKDLGPEAKKELENLLHKTEDNYFLTRKKTWIYSRNGFLFLGICLFISQAAEYLIFPLHDLVSESAILAGWVGLWKPMEMFLYDLPEIRKEKALYKKLLTK